MPEHLKAELAKLTQQSQRQDGANDQLRDLHAFANKLGLYDAPRQQKRTQGLPLCPPGHNGKPSLRKACEGFGVPSFLVQ
jgi:hypothetical protein